LIIYRLQKFIIYSRDFNEDSLVFLESILITAFKVNFVFYKQTLF
jgi:hypothetical protein